MEPSTYNDDQLDDLVAYALDALDPDERAAVEAYLRQHPEAQRLVAELRETANLLPYALTPGDPPPQLRQSIVERARAEAQVPQARGRIVPFWRRPIPAYFGAAAAAAAVAFAVWAGALRGEIAQLRGELARNQEQLQLVRQELQARDATLAVLQQDVTQVPLEGEGQNVAQLYRSTTGDAALIVALGPLPPDRVYQVWLLDGGAPRSAGLITPDAAGQGTLALRSDDVAGATVIAVTEEPAGGSPGPTTDILVSGQL
jgi:anti-sigma-K factor RskA